MATLISAETMQGSGEGVRASVNNHYFVEAETLTGTGAMPSAKIRSGVGAGIVVVDSWSPDDGDSNIEPLHSAKVNMHALAGVIEFEKLYDGGGTFEAGGALSQAVEIGSGVQLDINAPNMDFEDYVVNAAVDNAGNPDTWIWGGGTAAWRLVTRDNVRNWDGQHLEIEIGNGRSWELNTDATYWAATYEIDCYLDSTFGTSGGTLYIGHQITGTGTAMRGYCCTLSGSQYASFSRINSATSLYGLGTATVGAVANDVLWHAKIQFVNNGTTTWCYAKRWLDTASQPASYIYAGGDTTYANRAGWAGIGSASGSGNFRLLSDNYKISPDPAVYHTSGDWDGDNIDTTSLQNYSYGSVSWDETTPTDTTVAVKARWRNDGIWLPCTNGGEVPGIDPGEDTVAGSSKDSLELKVELATTDTLVTPSVENLRFYHLPIDPNGIEIEVGSSSGVVSDGTLDVWGIRQIIGGVNDEAWDDVWAETYVNYHLEGDNASVLARLLYGGVEIDAVIYDLMFGRWMSSNEHIGFMYSMNPIKYAADPVEVRWNAQEGWAPMSHVYGWVLIDYSMGMHRDLAFLVGHYQIDDQPSSLLVAELAINDHPGSLLTKGYKLDDHIASLLVQGPQLDDHFGMVMPAIRTFSDAVGSVITGVAAINDHPGQYLVYGVNRDGAVFVNVINDTTHAKLVAEGIVFS